MVIAEQTTTWPGTPIAAWPPATKTAGLDTGYLPPRGHGIAIIPADTPLACWLPIKLGLTPRGLRHSHKTWMAEEGTPEILAEQRLGHSVTIRLPGRAVLRVAVESTGRSGPLMLHRPPVSCRDVDGTSRSPRSLTGTFPYVSLRRRPAGHQPGPPGVPGRRPVRSAAARRSARPDRGSRNRRWRSRRPSPC
jgi:hypothetical protein